MKRLALTLAFLLGLAPPVWADYPAGFTAFNRSDYAIALGEFRGLAEQSKASAQFSLGVMYSNGQGIPQDYAEALKWYRLAAEQGSADAQFNLGLMYYQGQGVLQNYTEALSWYRKAAEQEHVSAWGALGKLYHLGEGVVQDYAKAVNWFQKAAQQRDAFSQMKLGIIYFQGQGVPQDYVEAHKWFSLAASGFPPGTNRDHTVVLRDIVVANMTAAQIAESQRLAREWKPKTQTAKAVSKSLAESPATSSETVKSIQTSLAALGYKPGPSDGIHGSRTRRAIEAFQRDHDLPVTGEASQLLDRRILVEQIKREIAGQKPKKVELSD